MKRKPNAMRGMAVLLTAALLGMSLGACADDEYTAAMKDPLRAVTKNQTIAEDSKWINSSIDGSIDAATETDVKDDFYTAVNKDWLLRPLPEDEEETSLFTDVSEQFDRNMDAVRAGTAGDSRGSNAGVMSDDALEHIQSLVYTMRDLGADEATRNAQSTEPLRPYIERIAGISSMEELTDYFCNADGRNLFDIQLTDSELEAPVEEDLTNYTVFVTPGDVFSLGDESTYDDASVSGFGTNQYHRRQVGAILGSLGYSSAEVQKLLTGCYRFEIKLARCHPSSTAMEDVDYLSKHNHVMDRAALEEMAGDYPIGQILDARGLGASETFTVTEEPALEEIGHLYRSSNLEDIKAYLIVNTVLQSADLLDEESYQRLLELEGSDDDAEAEETDEEDPDAETDGAFPADPTDPEEEARTERQALFTRFVEPYLNDAVQQIYIARFCSAAQKQQLSDMTERIMTAFRGIVSEADWMSEETREKALEKLDVMGLHILYPDRLIDYSELRFEGCENLLDCVARIQKFRATLQAGYVNQPVDRSNWNLERIPTTMVNAAYTPTDNSINIMAGIVSDDNIYSVDASEETNLARLGMIIGHEITHGFDTTGSSFDKNGRHKSWWTSADKLAFDTRAKDLVRYYSKLTPVSRGTYVDGDHVSGEAIADMGGMKSALRVAAEIPNFDYDEFFRSYAVLWRTHDTYKVELQASQDEHPVSLLRVNVIVMQFDEFADTYRIAPGDGMYLAADDRILVW